MPASFKRHDVVRLIQPPIIGRVDAVHPGDELQYVVVWTDRNGQEHRRQFGESQLEKVTS